jgi:hypothetical protein
MKCISKRDKNLILCAALLLSMIMTTEAKSRYPLQSTSCWRVDSVSATWDIVENTRFFFNGDTSIGGLKFFKLYKTGVAHYDKPYYFKDLYVGALRDSDDKIFYIKKNNTIEILLFDFNLNVGDTVKSLIGKGKKIISIDTLQNGRKVFYHDKDHYNLGYFIEGIGSNGGLFSIGSSYIILHSGELANYLICYSEDNSLVFQSEVGALSNCDIVNIDRKFSIDTTSIWRIDCDSDYYISPASERFQYFIHGDTLIGQYNYLKLYKTGFYLSRGKDGKYVSSFKNNVYVGAIRDSEGKYYFLAQAGSLEKVLYDFNLKVGDTIKSEVFKGEIVNSIDTCYDNRKRFHLGNDTYSYKIIIEGIGSTYDLIEGYKPGSYLICFSVNNIPVYHYPSIIDCRLDLQNTTFPSCDFMFLLPEFPTTRDKILLEVITCFPVPVNSEMFPFLSSYDIQKDEFTFNVKLNYVNDNSNAAEGVKIPYALFDTLSLGQLMQGQYRVNCTVNRIHTIGSIDTVFNEKTFMSYFMVSQSTITPSTQANLTSHIYVYPNPASEKITIKFDDLPVDLLSYELYDIRGKKIISERFCRAAGFSNFNIDTKMLQTGIYILKINTKDSSTGYKIVIDK